MSMREKKKMRREAGACVREGEMGLLVVLAPGRHQHARSTGHFHHRLSSSESTPAMGGPGLESRSSRFCLSGNH